MGVAKKYKTEAPCQTAAAELDYGEARVELVLNSGAPYLVKSHRHRHFELLFILKGRRGLLLGGRRYVARAGDVMIFRPGDVHEEFSCSKTISFIVLRFFEEDLKKAGASFPDTIALGPVFRLPERARFDGLFNRMLLEREKPDANSELLLSAYVTEFVVLLSRVAARRTSEGKDAEPETSRVLSAVELIRQNLSQSLRLDQLARVSFMSVSNFAHRFRREVGDSPKRFAIAERIERAKRALVADDRPAQDIARELGYENPYFFYRQFRQKTGLTTGEFRERQRRTGRQ
jgi:AraC-like DNA-binding protein